MSSAEILFTLASGLAINECCDLSPWAAHRLVRWSARRRYSSPTRAEIRAEELECMIDDLPGKLFKLVTALGFAACAVAISTGRAVSRHVPERITRRLSERAWHARPLLPPALTGPAVVLLDTSASGGSALERIQGKSFVNDLECQWVLAACWRINEEMPRGAEESAVVCVLAYYRAQARVIHQLLDAHRVDFPALRFQVVGTIDEAQGHEADYVILSFCRARLRPRPDSGGFLSNSMRFQVAATRAKRGLILIGHAPTLRCVPGAVGDLTRHLLEDSPPETVVFRHARDWAWAERPGSLNASAPGRGR